ncbi:MAG: DUF559 domain-containing protein [Rhodospirillaceae bacterium]|nr:DUF559 domain-containing protein [Rhodospirillaceae bacterium]
MKRYPVVGATGRARSLRRGMTDAESVLWRMLRQRQLEGCRFRRQVPIGGFIADFVCHEARLVIEVDGGQHDRRAEQEIRRMEFLRSQGFHVLRFWNTEVLANPQGVLEAIAGEARRHHPHPDPPPSRGRES